MEKDVLTVVSANSESTTETANTETYRKIHKASHIAKKVVGMMTTMAVMFILGAITAFADNETKGGGSNLSGLTSTLTTVVQYIGGGVGVWGIINLLEGYGSDNPGAKSQGIKQLAAGVGIALVATAVPAAIGI